ncbi:MAG: nicotinate-nucleotide adenylyltransferase [Deltaproteobacteria bacterium]|nr:nicotinate-nucleotide adenylyltransferase [Deltaproteobacteria bacterium]MBW2122253.1 nicotinate-nucleotide adenylyltransferase [Deltaproteobacteria bacterium]
MRLGLLGGTFNPIHFGHLRGVEEAREAFGLERVYFVPAAVPPHKDDSIEVSPAQRLEMVRLAIEDNPAFMVSDVELVRPGKSYSIDTLLYFRNESPGADLYFIVGMDSFLDVTTWKRYQDLFSLCHFVVLSRPGWKPCGLADLTPHEFWKNFRSGKDANEWVHEPSGFRTYFLERPIMDISSREIRERIRTGRSVRYMMREKVEAFVLSKGFYAKPDPAGEESR